MGNEQQGAVIGDKDLLEQFQRLGVQIICWFIQNEDIRRLEEKARQQQAVALASGEHLGGHPNAVGFEEEILQVAMDVPGFALKGDRLGLSGDIVSQ